MDIQPDFASYLHNPWGYPSPEEKAAMLVFIRRDRFIEGSDYLIDLNMLIRKYFGNTNNLLRLGLVQAYNSLKDEVIEQKLIGLILIGTNIEDDVSFGNYHQQSGNTIELTVKNITRYLITEYINRDNVEALCRETPNFNIYYKSN